MIFTTKSLIYTCATGVIGSIFYAIFGALMGLTWLGIALAVACAAIGFVIATFKIPDTNAMELTRKAGRRIYRPSFFKMAKI